MRRQTASIRNRRQLLLQSCRSQFRPHFNTPYTFLASRYVVTSAVAPTLPKSNPTVASSTASLTLPITSLYSSQSYNHSRAVGPIRLDVVPGKGLGWRATRDIATGELLLVSLPIAVLYGAAGEPPDNVDLVEALRQSWPRLTPLQRDWLLLLTDCCSLATGSEVERPRPVDLAVGIPLPSSRTPEPVPAARGGPSSSEQHHQSQQLQLQPVRPGRWDQMEKLLHRATALLEGAQREDVAPLHYGPADLDIPPPAIFGTRTLGISKIISPSSPDSSSGSDSGGGLVSELVQYYSYSEGTEDPAIAELLDVPPASYLGLWPEAALINHSCCPNSSLLVVGGSVYLRAGRVVQEGEEVTISYLGKALFLDAAERRARLRASHGFLCTCPRCTVEHKHFPTHRYALLDSPTSNTQHQGQDQPITSGSSSSSSSSSGVSLALDDALLAELMMGRRRSPGGVLLQALLDAVFGAGRFRTMVATDPGLLRLINERLASELEAAAHGALTAKARPREQQAELLRQLQGLLDQVEVSCAQLELPPRGRLMVLASVYGLVRLASDVALMSPKTTPEERLRLLQLAAEILEAVAPGSDGHVTAVVKASGVARRVHEADSAPARRAELAAATAHLARYGRELLSEPGLLRHLAATRRRLVTGSGLAASMGVLAWMQHVGPG